MKHRSLLTVHLTFLCYIFWGLGVYYKALHIFLSIHGWEDKDSSLYIPKEAHFHTVFRAEVHSRNAEKCVFIELSVLSNTTYIAGLYSMAYKSIDLCVLLSGVTFILALISVSLCHCIMHSQCHRSAPLKSECVLAVKMYRCTVQLPIQNINFKAYLFTNATSF